MNTSLSYPEAEVPAMSFVEFCHAYWKKGYHWPYPVPRHSDPSPAPSYHEYVEIRRRLGKKDDFVYERWQNLIRACYEYLAGPEGKQVSLPEVLAFLNQPPQEVVTTLAGYQPVYGWLLMGEQLLEGTMKDDVFCLHRVEGATEAARYCLQECIDFPKIQEQRQHAAAQEAGVQRENDERRAKQNAEHERIMRMAARDQLLLSVLSKALIFVLGLGAGYLVAHSGY